MTFKIKILRFIVPVSLVVLCCSFLKADNVKDEVKNVLDQMESYYAKTDNFSLEITYQAKKEKISGQLLEVSKGVYHQYKNGEYYFEVNDIITIVKDNITLIVDKNTKRIVLGENNLNQNSPLELNIEESLDFCSSIQHENNSINFNYSDGDVSPYHKLTIYYHPKNYSLEQVVLYPKQHYSMKKNERDYIDVKTVLEVDYRQYNQQKVTKDKLSLSPYVKKNNRNYSLHNDYSNYELINQIQ